MLRKLVFAAGCIGGVVVAVDGLYVNAQGNKPEELTISEIESQGVGGARYVTVKGARFTGQGVQVMSEDESELKRIVFAVGSKDSLANTLEGEPDPISMVVEQEDFGEDCNKQNGYCLSPGEAKTYTGVVEHGLDGDIAEKFDTKLASSVIKLDAGREPRPLGLNLTILILSVLGFLGVIYSFVSGGKRSAAEATTEEQSTGDEATPSEPSGDGDGNPEQRRD